MPYNIEAVSAVRWTIFDLPDLVVTLTIKRKIIGPATTHLGTLSFREFSATREPWASQNSLELDRKYTD